MRITLPRNLTKLVALALLACATIGSHAQAQSDVSDSQPAAPGVGDLAPDLGRLEWIAGDPVASLERGKTYFVFFWAPWSGASTQLFARLSELQRKNADRGLVVIGITSPDARGTTFEAARARVDELRAFASFRVAFDRAAATRLRYLGVGGALQPPYAVLVDRDGRIVVAGSSVEAELRLPTVLAAQHDLRALATEGARRREILEQGLRLQREFDDAYRNGNWPAARQRCDELLALDRSRFRRFAVARFQVLLLAAERLDDAYAEGRTLLEGIARDDIGMLGTIAWSIVDPAAPLARRDLVLAGECAQRSVDLSGRRNAVLLETLARVHQQQGELERAIEIQREAVRLDPTREGALHEFQAQSRAR